MLVIDESKIPKIEGKTAVLTTHKMRFIGPIVTGFKRSPKREVLIVRYFTFSLNHKNMAMTKKFHLLILRISHC